MHTATVTATGEQVTISIKSRTRTVRVRHADGTRSTMSLDDVTVHEIASTPGPVIR